MVRYWRYHGFCSRYVDEPVAQASTSHQHYYSQPGSILAPEPQISKEQLEALIRQSCTLFYLMFFSFS